MRKNNKYLNGTPTKLSFMFRLSFRLFENMQTLAKCLNPRCRIAEHNTLFSVFLIEMTRPGLSQAVLTTCVVARHDMQQHHEFRLAVPALLKIRLIAQQGEQEASRKSPTL